MWFYDELLYMKDSEKETNRLNFHQCKKNFCIFEIKVFCTRCTLNQRDGKVESGVL